MTSNLSANIDRRLSRFESCGGEFVWCRSTLWALPMAGEADRLIAIVRTAQGDGGYAEGAVGLKPQEWIEEIDAKLVCRMV